jgi:Endonuclease NucS
MGILAILSIEIPICAVSIIIKKKDGGFQFKSETELENFVYIHLDKLLNLSPIARQYRIGTEICDVLATDYQNNISIIELKNVEDRYIVQQLTRYYHGLIESKPKVDSVNYRKPAKLIAIAPSFHTHNFVDKLYNKLDFEFFTFDLTVDRSTGDIFFELTNVDTKEKYIAQIPEIKLSKVAKGVEAIKQEINYDEMIDFYMRLTYSSKLGLDPLSPEQLRERSAKYTAKCTKEFKINIQFIKKAETMQKSVSVKLPAKVRVADFIQWCDKYINGGIEGRGYKHRYVHKTRAGVFRIRLWFYNVQYYSIN